jgi:hypothetical protein
MLIKKCVYTCLCGNTPLPPPKKKKSLKAKGENGAKPKCAFESSFSLLYILGTFGRQAHLYLGDIWSLDIFTFLKSAKNSQFFHIRYDLFQEKKFPFQRSY